MQKSTITFIGAGHMGASLINGLITSGYPSDKIWATGRVKEHLGVLQQRLGVHTSLDNHLAALKADVLVLVVKPQEMTRALSEVKAAVREKQPLIVSVVTGVRIAAIQKQLACDLPIVRCMPNTPALIGAGASALFAKHNVNQQQKDLAESILRAVGVTVWLKDEALLDVVTALSGSGPAYFYVVMEALRQAAIDLGLDKGSAQLLTLQTALGASKLALESEQDISALRKQVASPGGTTEQAVKVLEDKHLREVVAEALRAAHRRAGELASDVV